MDSYTLKVINFKRCIFAYDMWFTVNDLMGQTWECCHVITIGLAIPFNLAFRLRLHFHCHIVMAIPPTMCNPPALKLTT